MRGPLLAMLLLSLPVLTIAQKDGRFVGTYRTVTRDAKTGFVLDDDVPVGQIRWLRLERSGKWEWRDFLSGFDGTWSATGSKVVLKIANGPGGPAKGQPPMVLKASQSGRVLTLLHKDKNLRLEMVWDPTIETRLQKAYEKALKRAGRG
ncbi:MAG: hypothetical protein ACO1SV_21020 [Fimbriimonas sp.]